MQTKILIGLCLAQFLILLLVYGELSDIADRPPPLPPTESGIPSEAMPARTVTTDQQTAGAICREDERLRQIVREELSAFLRAPAVAASDPAQHSPHSRRVDSINDEERRQEVSSRLQYHISVGRISTADMQKLQLEIAALGEPARTEMLAELVKALNTGRLEGRL